MEDGEDGHSVWYGALQAVKDPKVYMLILLQFSLLVGMAYVSLAVRIQVDHKLILPRHIFSQALFLLSAIIALLLCFLLHPPMH